MAISMVGFCLGSKKVKSILGFLLFFLTLIFFVFPSNTHAAACPATDGGTGDDDSTVNGVITISTNKTWTADGTNMGDFDCTGVDIDIQTGATLTLESYDSGDTNYTNDYGVTISTDSLTVTGDIDATGKGYDMDRGPGWANETGTSHGGWGGDGEMAELEPYGDVFEPIALGSGGDSCVNPTYNWYFYGGPGGGAIKLDVTGTLTLDGNIIVDGVDNAGNGASNILTHCYSTELGSGSAGSVYIDTNILDGSGQITANGKTNGTDSAGGRIAVYYETNSGFTFNTTNLQARGNAGGPGTVYIEQKIKANSPAKDGDLYIDNDSTSGSRAGLVEATYQFNSINLTGHGDLDVLGNSSDLTITSGSELVGDSTLSDLTVYGTFNAPSAVTIDGVDLGLRGDHTGLDGTIGIGTVSTTGGLTIYEHTWAHNVVSNNFVFADVTLKENSTLELNFAGTAYNYGENARVQFTSLTMETGSVMTVDGNDDGDMVWTDDYGWTVTTTGDLDLQTGGSIYLTGQGYAADTGPGYANQAGPSHGGWGQSNTVEPYGDVFEPYTFGSGGDTQTNSTYNHFFYGRPGGGAVKLDVSGTLTIDGTIEADGVNNTGSGSSQAPNPSSSAGGSVYIDSYTLDGSGVIRANGLTNGLDGSGGRIAIYYEINSGFPINLTTNLQAYGNNGGPGTVYVEQKTKAASPAKDGELYVDNNNINGSRAALVEDDYTLNTINLTRYGDLDILGQNSSLTISGPSNFTGDTTLPDLTVYGTFNGPASLIIDGVDLGLRGDHTGLGGTLDIGTVSTAGGLTIYEHTWAHNVVSSNFVFADVNLKANSTINLLFDGTAYNYGENARVQFDDLTMETGSVMTVDGNDDGDGVWTDDYGWTVITTGNFDLQTGSTINLYQQGYAADTGPGYANVQGPSHGGWGQSSTKSPYGDVYEPLTLGSGGDSCHNSTFNHHFYAYPGAGAVKLDVSGTFSIDGIIDADGRNNSGNGSSRCGNPSSSTGGSVYIDAYTIDGAGTIRVNGKTNGLDSAAGRIAIYYETNNGFPIDVTSNLQARGNAAGPGTIYVEQKTKAASPAKNGKLYVDNNNANGRQAQLLDGVTYEFEEINLTRYGDLIFSGQSAVLNITSGNSVTGDGTFPTLDITGVITFQSGGTWDVDGVNLDVLGDFSGTGDFSMGSSLTTDVTMYANTWSNTTGVYTFGDLTVDTNATLYLESYDSGDTNYTNDYGVTLNTTNTTIEGVVDTNTQGYPATYGPGVGTNGTTSGGGGGYGGAGGDGDDSSGGIIYGSSTSPTDLGSGGGTATGGGAGGTAGGAVKLTATSNITHNGTITANGGNGSVASSEGGGGGSGGSIWLAITGTFSGSGSITANGGNGGDSTADGTLEVREDGSSNKATLGTYTTGDWIDIKITLLSTGALYYHKAATDTDWILGYTSSYSSESNLRLGIVHYDTAESTHTDDWYIYQLSVADPVISTGIETTPSTGVPADNTTYHWQGRYCTSNNICSSWVSYGGNAESATDFEIILNATPNTPSSLGPTNYINGSKVGDPTPTLSFTLSDPDVTDTVKYQVQIDDDAGFGSPVTDYTSALAAQGSTSFTVGQAAGGGTYTTGSEGQALTDGNYYWRVKTIDNSSAESGWTTANSGAIAFVLDSTIPTNPPITDPGDHQYLTTSHPTYRWRVTSDTDGDLSTYDLSLDNGDSGDWSIGGISASGTDGTTEYNTYNLTYEGFSDADDTNDYISVVTKSHSDWGTDENDGEVNEGWRTFSVKAYDTTSNTSTSTRSFFRDTTSPSVTSTTSESTFYSQGTGPYPSISSDYYTTSDTTPTVAGRVTDNLSGDKEANYIASGPSTTTLTFEKEGVIPGTYSTVSTATITPTNTYWESDGTEVTDNNSQTSNKYTDYSHTQTEALTTGTYRVTVEGTDTAGNSTSTQYALVIGTTDEEPDPTPTPTPESDDSPGKGKDKDNQGQGDDKGKGKDKDDNVVDAVADTVTDFVEDVAQGISDIVEDVGEALADAVDKVSKAIAKALDKVSDFASKFIDDPAKTAKKLAKSADNLLDKLGKAIKKGWLAVIPGEDTAISSVSVSSIGESTALISWSTNHVATSKVNYGTTPVFESSISSSDTVESHSLVLTSLPTDTDIYFEVISTGRTTAYDAFRVFRTLGLTDEDDGTGTGDPDSLCPEGYVYAGDTEGNGVDGGEGVVCILDTDTDDDSIIAILFTQSGDGADPLGFIVEDLRTTVEEAGPVAQTTGVVATVVTTTGASVGLGALVVTTAALLKTTAAVYNSVTSLGGLGSTSLGIPAAIKFLGITLTNILSNLGFIRKRKRRKEKTIGLVFDTVTGKPVNGVYLTFYSESGNLKSAISNKDGRYTTTLTPGDYKLSIHKEGYRLSTKEELTKTKSSSGLSPSTEYPSLHHQGSDITITKQPFVNIAVPVTKTKPSTTTQKVLSLPKRLQGGVEKHSVIFLTISFIISGYAYIANPNLLNNTVFYLVLIAGVIQVIGSIIKSRTWGVVKTKTGKVIPQATLELYSIQSTEKQPHPTKVTRGKDPTSSRLRGARESLYTTTQTDTHGRYQFTPENGTYILKTRDTKGKITSTQEVTVTDQSPRVDVGVRV